jgi:signal transduction histidine kinase
MIEKTSTGQNKFQALQKIARAIGSTLDTDRLLRLIVAKSTELMAAERSSLFIVSDDGKELWTRVLEADEVQEIRLPVGTGIAGWVAQNGEAVNIPDAYEDERFSRNVDLQTGYRTRSVLCVPMRNHEGVVRGVLQVLNKRGGEAFTEDDEELLTTLASQAAVAVQNAQLYQSLLKQNEVLKETQRALERRMRERDLLLEMQEQVSAATFLDELLERLISRTATIVGAEAAAILLRDDDTDRLYFRSALGEKTDELRHLSLDLGQGVAGWVTKTGQSALVDDPANDERYWRGIAEQLDFVPRNILCVPLPGADGPLGALELLNKLGRDSFDQDDERLLTLIAGSIGQAIELAHIKEERIKEQRLAGIGQMLSGVLHDLKTPMTVISGYAQLMAQNDDAEVRREYVGQILKQFEVMSAMTKEVLAFARGESNVLIRKVYLHRYIPEIQQHLEHELAGKQIELDVQLDYKGVAHFDEKKFHRVIHNIARNAAQAMPNGGRFTVNVRLENGRLVFTFTDTGQGIPDEVQGRLFQAFATAGKEGGTGLGLAIVKKIIEEHHGEIDYSSSSEGTTFVISLPIKRTSTGEAALSEMHH